MSETFVSIAVIPFSSLVVAANKFCRNRKGPDELYIDGIKIKKTDNFTYLGLLI
jgi:hypothetical protein